MFYIYLFHFCLSTPQSLVAWTWSPQAFHCLVRELLVVRATPCDCTTATITSISPLILQARRLYMLARARASPCLAIGADVRLTELHALWQGGEGDVTIAGYAPWL